MNFHPQEASQSKVQGSGPVVLQIDDLNNLIDSLKRREENIIQLLDYNLKFRGSSNHMDVIHLRGLYNQLEEREKKRIEQEDSVLQRYLDLHISDDYQKKLITKMKNKIIQLNSSARDKLIQLGIFKQAKQAYLGLAAFEEALALIVNKTPLDAYGFLTRIVENSRKRFNDEVELEPIPIAEFIKQKSLDAGQNSLKPSLNLPKPTFQKSITPSILTKEEEKKHYESDKTHVIETNLLSNHHPEILKVEKSPTNEKGTETRPNFDLREELKASFDVLGIQKGNYARYSSETTRHPESISQNETMTEQISPTKAIPSYRENKPEVVGLSLNLNNSTMACEKSLAFGSNISSRTPYVKKVKITSNKRSVCLEEPNDPQLEKKDSEKKEPKPNKEAWLKNYDILKIEYTPLPTATKKETKKLLMEKIYKELLATNTEIKKTIKRYTSSCASIISKEQEKEQPTKRKPENLEIEPNRSNIFTPKAYSGVGPMKQKAQTLNPTQRSIFFADSTRDTEHIEIANDNFLNVVNPFYPNSTSNSTNSKQNKELLAKKPGSTKFLILPKLNLFPDGHVQSPFPTSWPISSQGSKPVKSNLIMDMGNRPRFEKLQKGVDRPINHLLAETKQTLIDEKSSICVVNQPPGSGSKVFSTPSKNYPIALFPLEGSISINKQIPL